jgi:hypothetical protein
LTILGFAWAEVKGIDHGQKEQNFKVNEKARGQRRTEQLQPLTGLAGLSHERRSVWYDPIDTEPRLHIRARVQRLFTGEVKADLPFSLRYIRLIIITPLILGFRNTMEMPMECMAIPFD